jgi:mono/diheme cytochrome c family protein
MDTMAYRRVGRAAGEDMQRRGFIGRSGAAVLAAGAWLCLAPLGLVAQPAPPAMPDWLRTTPYEKRTTDPAAVERGRALFTANGCTFCHGADIRGGNGGPSLLRAQTVLHDRKGELIAVPIQKGVAGTAMVAFPLKEAEIADIAEFLHSFPVSGYDVQRLKPAIFTLGNPQAGKKYFARHCASCHQADGDLKGIATRTADPRNLQQRWLMPRTATPTTVTVKLADGGSLSGRLVRIDEFLVTLTLDDGRQRTLERNGDVPQVEMQDPHAAHKALLPTYRDDDIHDVTAYLATLK